MKTFKRVLIWIAILPLVVVIGCKDNDPAPANDNFTTLTEYMVANNMDISDVVSGWITAAPSSVNDVPAFVSSYYIMDIRSADAYAAGHIEGAVNTTLGKIVDDATSVTKPILVVCYTGQTAAHATVALRLSGHPDAKVLMWGMSGWRSDLSSSWTGNSGDNGNVGVGNSNWVTTSTETPQTFDVPAWTTTSTDPAEMLKERVTYMTTKGFQGIGASDVLATPSNYFINNFWSEADVTKYGHIANAYRINPLTIANNEIKNLDPTKTVVTYCWTGQTSSMVTAYLTVLGYDAKSLKFGANSMIYSALEAHKFVQPTVDLPVVTD
jgi:rhodanese-related sulfurtransferase